MSKVFLDIETASSEELYTFGPGFCRLAGYAVDDGPVQLTSDMTELISVIEAADRIVAHNALGFDLAALEHWHGLDVGRLVEEGRIRDTLLLARHNDPPFSGHADDRRYSLDALAKRLDLGSKIAIEGQSALKKLAEEHGGFHRIPIDNQLYRQYLVEDVELLRAIDAFLRFDSYLFREHKVMWRLNHISRSGFLVDVDEARNRLATQHERVQVLQQRLEDLYGMPTGSKAPHRTAKGADALAKAFTACGVEPPRTPRGSLATSKNALADLLDEHPDNDALAELVITLRSLNGERSVTQTILDHTRSDGRVHPSVDARQTTGRISVTKPGLTVMGKRDRANVLERSLLLPDKGDVLVGFDLSQVDARAIAAHCQDPGYLSAFEPGKDYHTEMAVELFGDATRRNDAKPVTHATTYGMGAKGLSASAGIEQTEARALLNTLDNRFPGLARFKRQVRAEAERNHILWNAFGRPLRVEEGKEYTKAPAAIGQGTARDLMMEGILRLPEWLLPRLRAVVHDEIVLSVPVEQVEAAEAAVLAALQFSFAVVRSVATVQVLADKSDRGHDWADCYRSEKKEWPEVARQHREQPSCTDEHCTWHLVKDETKRAA